MSSLNISSSDIKVTGRELGRGSFGLVKQSLWRGTLCATKHVHDNLSPSLEGQPLKDYLEQCRRWSDLRHPNVLQLYGVFYSSKSTLPVIVCEVMMTSLRLYLDDVEAMDSILITDKILIAHQILLGLVYIHGVPWTHRSLTTSNIMLNTDTLVTKITDVGISRALDPDMKLQTGNAYPAADFMPPEVFIQQPRYDDKTDIFSLGCVLISILSHKWPKPGPVKVPKGDDYVSQSEYERRSIYCTDLTEQESVFSPIIEKCLEDRSKKRPASLQILEEVESIRTKMKVDTVQGRLARWQKEYTERERERSKEEILKLMCELESRNGVCLDLQQSNNNLKERLEVMEEELRTSIINIAEREIGIQDLKEENAKLNKEVAKYTAKKAGKKK